MEESIDEQFLQILSRCSRFVMISPILLSILGIFSLMSLASGQGTFLPGKFLYNLQP